MSYSVFSQETFASVLRVGDSQRFGIDLKFDRQQVIDLAMSEVNSDPQLAPFDRSMVRGKECVSYRRYRDHLILRVVCRHLRRRLRLTLPSREKIIKGVIESLMDSTPMYVLRRDITSFYESIPTKPLKDQLLYDSASSEKMRRVLRRYFEQHCSSSDKGIPRGVGLSAILAELAMKDFDRRVREVPGVHKCYRFSDDIVIFCFDRFDSIDADLKNLLPDGMAFSHSKTVSLDLTQTSIQVPAPEFEYLGYRFRIRGHVGDKSARRVEISIAAKKISRIMTRTVLTFKDFNKTGDFRLLLDRLRFISCNYRVRRNAMATAGGPTHVRSGIFYSYRFCGVYTGADFKVAASPSASTELRQLDGFYHALRKGGNSQFAARIATLSPRHRAVLARISFLQGFSRRLTVRFAAKRLHRIRAVWRNA
ncbi:MAG: RNA-directed DNA polymerase [Acidobacteria bacterium]|nr:RNA-directed DNA polymerase [Acidobacteriota bacterium]